MLDNQNNINYSECIADEVIALTDEQALGLENKPDEASRAIIQFVTSVNASTPVVVVTENGKANPPEPDFTSTHGIFLNNFSIYEIRGFSNMLQFKMIPFVNDLNVVARVLYFK